MTSKNDWSPSTSREISCGGDGATRASLMVEYRRVLLAARIVVGLILMSAAYTWYLTTQPKTLPECSDVETVEAIESMTSAAAVPGRWPALERDSAELRPRLLDIRQIGYAPAERQRGCVGTLAAGAEKVAFAYVIGPDPEQPEQLAFMGADRAIVEARFSNIDKHGNFANNAAPVGRDNLERALRNGFETLEIGRPRERVSVRNTYEADLPLLTSINPDREREIADIEPLGPCSKTKSETQYACPVLIERNDPLLIATGRGASQNLRVVFTIEQTPGSQQWRVADDFSAIYLGSIADSRGVRLR